MTASITADEVQAIAEEAYIYCFPMLMGYRAAYGRFLNPSLPSYQGEPNEIVGEARTEDHTSRGVITPNADTPYSSALLDLRAEPVVLEVPAISDRYYVMQFVDLYGTNPHFVGSRATGPGEGTYLAVGPRWDGEIPAGVTDVLRFETDLGILVGRTQLLGADDMERLSAIISRYRLRPLSAYLGTAPAEAPDVAWPPWDDPASRDERFIGYMNFLLEFCQPPHPSEAELMDRFAQIGIAAGVAFDATTLDDATRAALQAGVDAAREAMGSKAQNLGDKVNGWDALDAFGNRDFYSGDYLLRAAAAMVGYLGNDKIEASYPMTHEDSEGRPLDGTHRYRMTLKTPPPVKAFWSVTMYDTSYDGVAGYMIENPIDRYLVSSITPGLAYADDGSLTIFIQRDEPETAEGRANWLPSPEGTLYLAMRLYWPEEAALNGTWEPPPVTRVD